MQSAHILGTSSSNGLITKADSGLARHEHHQSECTQSLGKAYVNTKASDILAKHINECTTTSQVKGTEQAYNMHCILCSGVDIGVKLEHSHIT